MPLFADRCAFVGMVHLKPLPGSPAWQGSMRSVLEAAVHDAQALVDGGCDAILVENMGDVPYLRGRVDPETVAAMSLAVGRLSQFDRPVGIQLLAGANREALGVAVATEAAFIRVEAFAYAHVADEGWLQASAGELLRTRKALGHPVDIWADVQKKHSAHAVTGDLTLRELAEGSAFCGADALVITGAATGHSTDLDDVRAAASAGLPVVIGSGVTSSNVNQYAEAARAVIVGSDLKFDGDWRQAVDVRRVQAVRKSLDQSTAY